MAERSNATSKKNQDAAQDVSTLQKRGRRRLVGAIALVLLAVIVLPMVLDPEPRQNAPTVSIRIPSEEGTKFTPKAVVKPGPPPPEAAAVAPKLPEPAPVLEKPAAKAEPKAPSPVEKPIAKAETRAPEKKALQPAPKAAEKSPVAPPAPVAAGEQFVVQVGAYGSVEKVKEVVDLLKEAKIPQFTENVATASGTVTRVRMGPFASKAAAEKERERVISIGRAKGLALNPAGPVQK